MRQLHPEHLNTPRLVADSAGAVVWRWEQQEPFGVNVADENPSSLGAFEFPLRFPGQYADKETGLHYNYFRDYDPAVGRYVESDPIGLEGGINTYRYVESNPIGTTDPTGEFPVNPFGAVGAASFNFFLQAYLNYQSNGRNLAGAFQCVDLGNVAAAGAVGFFLPGGFAALQRGWATVSRGASFRRFAATAIVAGLAAIPMSTSLGVVLPTIPLNRIIPTFGTNCSCRPD